LGGIQAEFPGKATPGENWLPDHRRHGALALEKRSSGGIAPNLGFEFCSGRFEFFQRHFICPLRRRSPPN
jgi:hypothetical protein